MGAIPLPALAAKAPEIDDPVQKVLSLRGLMQGQQLQQQQIQQSALQLKQQQLEAEDQQKIRAAYMQSGGDLDKTAALAAQAGVNPKTVIGIKAAALEGKQKLATLTKDQLANQKAQAEMVGQQAGAALQAPPEQRAGIVQQGLSGLVQQGIMTPEVAQQSFQQYQQQGDDWLKLHQTAAMSTQQQIEQVQKDQQQKELARHHQEQEANAANETTQIMKGGKLHSVLVNKQSGAEVKDLGETKQPSTVVNPPMGQSDASAIADAIQNGDQPPTLQGLYRNAAPVRAELARRGVPLAQMETDWKATQRYMGTLNGPQQVRLRQNIETASDSLDKIDSLYNEFKQLAPSSGFKVINKATLAAAKQLPGRAGAVATALDAQIGDLTSELGSVYMGGNSPTDHALGLAAKNLSSDWNQETFEEGMKQAHANIKIRQNSITHGAPAGVGNNQYFPQQTNQQQQQPATKEKDPLGIF